MPKFYTAKKWLTDYALSCGYMEVTKDYTTPGCQLHVSLSKQHLAYRVSYFDRQLPLSSTRDYFNSLTEARKAFTEKCKHAGLTRKVPTQFEMEVRK